MADTDEYSVPPVVETTLVMILTNEESGPVMADSGDDNPPADCDGVASIGAYVGGHNIAFSGGGLATLQALATLTRLLSHP